MGRTKFKPYVGLAPRAGETGETDRKGQAMSKAGPSPLRATFYRAADTARRQDPQLARIYYVQMTEHGATYLKACCIVAGHLAERAWAVLHPGTPYGPLSRVPAGKQGGRPADRSCPAGAPGA